MSLRFSCLLLMALCYGSHSYCQQEDVRGQIIDYETGKPVPDCYVIVISEVAKPISAISDINGYFKIIAEENVSVKCSHINYQTKIIQISDAEMLKIYLIPLKHELDEITIYSSYKGTNRGNEYIYTPKETLSSISIIGEPDVIRHISSMPGVSQGMEGTLGLFVRGANNGSNAILFNQVPIRTSSHLGLFSSFPPDIIQESAFYLGGIPAEYGNFSSSLISVNTKKQYGSNFTGKISLSPYLTGGYLSLPLKKEKASVQLSGRTSLLPLFLNAFVQPNDGDIEKMKAQILDFSILTDWKIDDRNKLNLMFYTTNDYFDYRIDDSQNRLNWGSTAFKAGWDFSLTDKMQIGSFIYYVSSFSRQEQKYYDYYVTEKLKSLLRLGSDVKEFSGNIHASFEISDKLNTKFGLQYQWQEYTPLSEKSLLTNENHTDYENKFDLQGLYLTTGFFELKYVIPEIITTSMGFRGSLMSADKKANWNFDLHFLADVYLTEKWGFELTYDRLVQYYHVLEGLPIGWSHNVTIPATESFPEEITHQFFSGVFLKHQSDYIFNATLGGFYRKMKNLVSYINSSNLFGFTDVTWYDEVDTGNGESFGLELSGSLRGERIGTTLAYTLSKSDRLYSKINEGNKFPFKFDRRHILNFQAKFTTLKGVNRKGKKREQHINSVISYSTGNRATLPVGSYQGIAPPFWEQRESGLTFPFQLDDNAYNRQIMSRENEFKMKDYFRIDLAYTFIRYGQKINNEFSISVFNILNRKNPFLYYYDDNKWFQLSIVPVMPTFRWSMTF